MNRAMSRTINVFDGYLKENLSEVVMYIGFMFIFPVIFYLYNILLNFHIYHLSKRFQALYNCLKMFHILFLCNNLIL